MWAMMLAITLGFAWKYSGYVPISDAWYLVPYVTGEEPVTLSWLWEQHGDHRIPLPKLLYVALFKLTGNGYYVGGFVNVFLLSGAAFGMIWGAKRLRGWLSYTDAFFPLALLSWGGPFNYVTWFQISEVAAPVVESALLLLIVLRGQRLTLGTAVLAALGLVLLSLCGPSGLPLVLTLAIWLGCWGLIRWFSREPTRKRDSLVVWGAVSAAVFLVGLYFVGFQRSMDPSTPPNPGLWRTLRTGIEFCSVSLGAATSPFWLYSGLAVFGVVVFSVVGLFILWLRQPSQDFRALGLLLFLGGKLGMVCGLAWGRAILGEGAALTSYYLVFAIPMLCGVYFTWMVCKALTLGRLVQVCLLTTVCGLFPLNVQYGLAIGEDTYQVSNNLTEDLLAGTPTEILAEHHARILWYDGEGAEESLAAYLRALARADIWPYRCLKDVPGVRVAIPVVPVEVNQMTWKDGVGEGYGGAPYLVFALPEPQLVHAIRVTCAYERTDPPITFQAFWRKSDQQNFEEARSYTQELKGGAGERTITIPVNATIGQFRIDPDVKPCVIRIAKIELLVPAADHARAERADEDLAYQDLLRHVREAVRGAVPPGATVLVVSQGDDDLLKLPGRTGQHFPQTKDGTYDGNPADSKEAITRLEALRVKGDQYLLFPEPAFWWLDHYKEFKQHLEGRYARVYGDDHCIIYRLSAPGENKP
jgi:hypothetical protein